MLPTRRVISGVVLAAGEGRRFGGTKQLAPLDGRPLLLFPVEALRDAGVGEVVVVTGHDAEAVEAALPGGVRTIRNVVPRGAGGIARRRVARGRRRERGRGDPPRRPTRVSAEDVRALIDGFAASRARIVRLRYADGPGPALLSREVFAEAGHLHGDTGARVLIASHPDWVEEVEVDVPRPATWILPEDLDQV